MQKITDTHIHIWETDVADYAWLRREPLILQRNYLIEELEAERIQAGVTEGILVQAANNLEDTDHMLATATVTDWINGVVGWLPLTDPGMVEQLIEEKYLKNKYFKGVRHLIHDEADDEWLLQPEVIKSLKLLASYDLTYDIVGVKTAHIETALKVAEQVPGLKMIFDHLNNPPVAAKEKFGGWGQLMKTAAGHGNFCVKISGLGYAAKNPNAWNSHDIEPYIDFVLQHFGTNRCCCGGDWPVSLLADSYTYTWKNYTTALSTLLDEADQQKVLSDNAQMFYNL